MKTTKEDHEWLRTHAATCRKPGLFARLTADLDRLAAIEEARAKGGLTDEELNQALGHVDAAGYQILRRLDDARNATNEELGRVRGMLAYAVSTYDIKDCPCRRCVNIREYLAEVEASDGR
jgi:hypothetical protein